MIKHSLILIFISTYIFANTISLDGNIQYEKHFYETQDSKYLDYLDKNSDLLELELDISYEYKDHVFDLIMTYFNDKKEDKLFLNTFEYGLNNIFISKKSFHIGNSLIYKPLKNFNNYSEYDNYGNWLISYDNYYGKTNYKFIFIPKVSQIKDTIAYQNNNTLGVFSNSLLFDEIEFNLAYLYSDGYNYKQSFKKHQSILIYANSPLKNSDIIMYTDFSIKTYDDNINLRSLIGFSYPLPSQYNLNLELYYNDRDIEIYEDTNKRGYHYSNNKYLSIGYSLFKENILNNIDLMLLNDYNTYKDVLKSIVQLTYIKNKWNYSLELENTKLYNSTQSFDKSNVYKNNFSIKLKYEF